MAVLIEKNGGIPTVAPSMREVPIEDNPDVFTAFERMQNGEFEMVILLTGVGTRAMETVLAPRYGERAWIEELKKVAVVPRGPKPQAVLREWGVPWSVSVPSPNTWRELMTAIEGRPERQVAIQEYGRSNMELINALKERGCRVTPMRVYQWDLPLDTAPLRAAAHAVAENAIDAILLTTSMQMPHLFRMAEEEGILAAFRKGLEQTAICSIGPTTSESLDDLSLKADMEPSLPKMGVLVKEAGEQTSDIIARKRKSKCKDATVSGTSSAW